MLDLRRLLLPYSLAVPAFPEWRPLAGPGPMLPGVNRDNRHTPVRLGRSELGALPHLFQPLQRCPIRVGKVRAHELFSVRPAGRTRFIGLNCGENATERRRRDEPINRWLESSRNFLLNSSDIRLDISHTKYCLDCSPSLAASEAN